MSKKHIWEEKLPLMIGTAREKGELRHIILMAETKKPKGWIFKPLASKVGEIWKRDNAEVVLAEFIEQIINFYQKEKKI